MRSPEDGAPAAVRRRAAAAARQRRAAAFRRRRQVLALLVVLTAAVAAPAVLFGGAVDRRRPRSAGTLLVAYLALLVRRGRHEAERAQKVRYLTPIRAPRPSVVVIGSGAVR